MENKEWNYDRIVSVIAQLQHVERDMMTVVKRGTCNENMKGRMIAFLQNSIDQLQALKVE